MDLMLQAQKVFGTYEGQISQLEDCKGMHENAFLLIMHENASILCQYELKEETKLVKTS